MPVLRSARFDDSAAVPIWLQSKRGVCLTGDPCDEQQYELLLRALHKAPPPPAGPKLAFLTSDAVGLAPNAVSESIPQATPTTRGDDRPQQSPIAYAWYEAAGSNVARIQVYVRPTGEDSRMFKFETSTGERMSGTELEVAEKYLTLDMRLKDKGYKGYRRMTTFKGTGRNFNLA